MTDNPRTTTLLIIGAGGVGRAAVHTAARFDDVFDRIVLASRTIQKCRRIADEAVRPIDVFQIDANDPSADADLIRRVGAQVVLNAALPYQNVRVMQACLEAGADYVDTAVAEEPDRVETFCYYLQHRFDEAFREKGRTAVLSCGFDPGVVNAYCAWARDHLFDRIRAIDIVDCNAGDHGYPFATNFNPEINLREVTAEACWWEGGEWRTAPALTRCRTFDFPVGIGPRKVYLMFHEEVESLANHFRNQGVEHVRFWMSFSDRYLAHLFALENVGLTSIEPVDFEGRPVVPIRFLKQLLPDPAEIGPRTRGKTCIGCIIAGEKDGAPRRVFIYNTCDHQECLKQTHTQAVAFTTGVPAAVAARLLALDRWRAPGTRHVEDLPPEPFLDELARNGLPWTVEDLPVEGELLMEAEPYRLP